MGITTKTAINFTDTDYTQLNMLFSGGDISACSKRELERFSVMLSRPNAYTHFSKYSFPQICETVRTLILVRMSEDQNIQAQKESRLALIIACIALLAGIVQATAAIWQLASSSPILVQANIPMPVRAVEAMPVYLAPMSQVQQTPVTVVPKRK